MTGWFYPSDIVIIDKQINHTSFFPDIRFRGWPTANFCAR